MDDLGDGNLCIAVMTFLRNNDKYKVKPSKPVPQGKFSLHIEEQKLPPMGDELVFKSASVVPMLSSEWQDAQDPEDREKSASAEKFRWDGLFVDNPQVRGTWKVIAQVTEISEFDPNKKNRVNRPPFSKLTLEEEGRTGSPVWAWSGNTLMNLTKHEALKMKAKTLNDGKDYLFVETGGFGTRNKPGWKTQLLVLAK
jgi:hypothetical protein